LPQLSERLIVYGALHDLDDDRPVGVALAVQMPSRGALATLLGHGRAGLGGYGDVGIHDWQFGGRR
jgi:hypothetical protein